jgi:hypothetical protein
MAIIKNKSKFTVGVFAKEFSQLIGSESQDTVPDDVARKWAERDVPAELIKNGLVLIAYDSNKPETAKPAKKSKPKKEIHWRTLIADIKVMTSLDELERLHAAEERPRVVTAIETRMAELQG